MTRTRITLQRQRKIRLKLHSSGTRNTRPRNLVPRVFHLPTPHGDGKKRDPGNKVVTDAVSLVPLALRKRVDSSQSKNQRALSIHQNRPPAMLVSLQMESTILKAWLYFIPLFLQNVQNVSF